MLSGRRGGGCVGTRAAGRGGRPAAGRGIGRMPLGNRSITGVVPGVLVGSLGAPFGFASLILWFFSSYITRKVVALNDSIIGKTAMESMLETIHPWRCQGCIVSSRLSHAA